MVFSTFPVETLKCGRKNIPLVFLKINSAGRNSWMYLLALRFSRNSLINALLYLHETSNCCLFQNHHRIWYPLYITGANWTRPTRRRPPWKAYRGCPILPGRHTGVCQVCFCIFFLIFLFAVKKSETNVVYLLCITYQDHFISQTPLV